MIFWTIRSPGAIREYRPEPVKDLWLKRLSAKRTGRLTHAASINLCGGIAKSGSFCFIHQRRPLSDGAICLFYKTAITESGPSLKEP